MTDQLDENGYLDLSDMERDFFYLEEMRKQKAALEAGIERCEKVFKDRMLAAGANGFTVNGVVKVIFKKNATFPVAKYCAANPVVAAVYQKTMLTFDVESFKRDRPQEYQMWQGHTFKYAQPKRGN